MFGLKKTTVYLIGAAAGGVAAVCYLVPGTWAALKQAVMPAPK